MLSLKSRPASLSPLRWPGIAAVLVLVFILSQILGGESWDEYLHRIGHDDHVRYAGEVLTGDTSRSFHEIDQDLEYYGLISMEPASTIAHAAADILDLPTSEERRLFRVLLHASAFAWAIATAFIVYLLVRRETGRRELAAIAGLLLLLYPTWLGHGFFNFKDLPQAFFYTLALWGGREAIQDEDGAFRKGLLIVAIATVGAATVRFAVLPLLIPQYLLIIWALLSEQEKRPLHLRDSVIAGLLTLLCIYAFTPASWRAPLEYLQWNIAYMSQHGWNSCTITLGDCINVRSQEWSALQYLISWLIVRLPLLILILTPPAAGLLLWRGNAFQRHLILAAFLPVIVLSGMNSTLYDGIRHVLFIIPSLVLMVVLAADVLARTHPAVFKAFRAGAYATLALFLADNIRLFPFNYVYFNEPSRFFVTEKTFDTDYWGYSLREAAIPLADAGRNVAAEAPILYTAWPQHLIEPFAGPNTRPIPPETLDEGVPHYQISLTRGGAEPSASCGHIDYVERRLVFAPRPMRLSFAAQCEGD